MSGPETGRGEKVRSLRELPQEIAPPRDLWPEIEARLQADRASPPVHSKHRRWLQGRPLAAAAVVAALVLGIFIGRSDLPFGIGSEENSHLPALFSSPRSAAYVTDPQYQRHRAALVRSLDERMNTLPPEAQEKIRQSLVRIQASIREIEVALGNDPGNPLLQELLVNSYQDEMRVLAAVYEVSTAGEEI